MSQLISFTPAHLRLGVRAAVAALASYALSLGVGLENGYWAVITSVLVVQSTVGASLSIAVERALGTLVGGIVGVGGALLVGTSLSLNFVALACGILLTSTLAARSSAFKLAPVTVAIVLLAIPTDADPMRPAMFRLLEIGIGGVVGVLSALLVLPARAVSLLQENCADAVRQCAILLAVGRDGLLGGPYGPEVLGSHSVSIRKALRTADTRAKEARAERRFADQMDPTPIVRSCRRLWHSVIILLRSASHPLPDFMKAQIETQLHAAVEDLCDYMVVIARQLEGADADEETALKAHASVSELEARAAELNAEGKLDPATGPDLTSLFAAISACTHVRDNLDDLSTRLADKVSAQR